MDDEEIASLTDRAKPPGRLARGLLWLFTPGSRVTNGPVGLSELLGPLENRFLLRLGTIPQEHID
jgi:hypothetical protein